jgi:PAS domain S-box-containing protein
MKRFLRNQPIQRKLAYLTIVTSGFALLAACIAFFLYEQRSFRKDMVDALESTARIAASNSTGALSFDNAASASQLLHSFEATPTIEAAVIYSKNGTVFAEYQRKGPRPSVAPPPMEHNTHRFTDDTFEIFQDGFTDDSLELFHDIVLDGEVVGTIYFREDLSALAERLRRYGFTLVAVMAGATLIALLLMRRLQRVFTGPILNLTAVMREVATHGNYMVRARRESNDELGQLTDGFNEMLRQIQERDTALEEARSRLEDRVVERTRELQDEIAERRRTEQERDRFVTLSQDMLCITGFEGRFRRINPSFKRLLGYEESYLLAESVFEFVHPEDRTMVADRFEDLKNGHSVSEVEVRVRRQDGQYLWIAWSATPIPEEGIFYGYGRDITARRQAEEEMRRLHQELIEISRQAGMAEVATNVLHNVGNVLNSINVACSVVTDMVRKSRITNVARISELLRQHSDDLARFFTQDPAGQKLPDFLEKLSRRLADEQTAILEEIRSLGHNIDHIKEIVSVQQAYARNTGGIRETLPLQSLVEDAIRMNESALARHRVTVVREYQDVPPVSVEKHKVLQILLNLVSNAKYAVSDNGHELKQLVVRVSGHDGQALVSMADNGVGIPSENLTRIFSHGFTTKKNGHGFGLHSSSIAAKELGGQLSVASDGPGKGATFTLELPFDPPGPSFHENVR